jgi:hypothetical protein
MALKDFFPISLKPEGDRAGLVWHAEVQPGRYFAELQTSILPQLIHLIVFDMADGNKPVYEALSAFEIGDTLNAEKQQELNAAVQTGLAVLNS